MHPLGLTNSSKSKQQIKLKKKTRYVSLFFIIGCLLPFLVVALFAFDVIKGAPAKTAGIEAPVAKVVTEDGIGTAFLISSTKLLTARHVIFGLDIADEVVLSFEKADPPRQVTAKVHYVQPVEVTPYHGQVSLDYFLTDFAVLEIPEIEDIIPLDIGDSEIVEELDEIILVGYPNNDYSKTDGKINSKSYQNLDLFKSDVTANRGNSGGPAIYKEDLTVVGIIVGSGNPENQGENIIVKINNIVNFLERQGIDLF